VTPFLIVAAVSYLLGSIPFGYLLVRLFRGEDVRRAGSGNIGATNVARSSPLLGVLTLLLDAGKGFASVLLASILFKDNGSQPLLLMSFAALFAVIGHSFPVWLGFRGGKGVATGLGSFILIAPKALLCVIAVFVAVVLAFRYVSLGSVVAVAAFPVLVVLLHDYRAPETILLIAIASLLIIWKHQANIHRLLTGTEPKFRARRG
jgi:glycerol-3-phosphate acyltransferase PlsY